MAESGSSVPVPAVVALNNPLSPSAPSISHPRMPNFNTRPYVSNASRGGGEGEGTYGLDWVDDVIEALTDAALTDAARWCTGVAVPVLIG